MSDFLAEKRKEIKARLDELRPLVDEYARLEAAEKALAGVSGSAASTAPRRTPARRGPGRPKGSGKASGTGRRGRPKGSGNRANEALALITDQPGITIPELADKMGIKQNYLYRVVPGLAEEGKVIKSGKGWHLKK